MNSLDEYRKRVAELARTRTGEPIANGSFEHAAIIIEQMFKSANKHISILSGNLNPRVYGRDQVVDEAKLFLAQSNHTAKILLESDDQLLVNDHPFFECLKNNHNLEVRIVPTNLRDKYKYHFLVMDGDSYRFEPEKDEPTAVAAFGDKETSERMTDIFSVLWDWGKQVKLPSPIVAQEST